MGWKGDKGEEDMGEWRGERWLISGVRENESFFWKFRVVDGG